ncbi:RND family transporter [Alishewanella sp. SMS8]|uniref:efflux RND transporter permease subunit n=1 Tax=Alishewanella sp. SMS8 TaxID=2994676 RepID=UPI00274040C2|nr:MMPL family transporter [Alishewanella sp. SMS8]MDP5035928.1 MMPL family transporter [Alishewanella sp.]MDP5185675.1 MMPL family transporter [Alishewanella sp.]MDP5460747.1 MMPL family transporter [Alishewanella sp. SMS8]
MNWLVNKIEIGLFRHRLIVIVLFALTTLLLLFKATDIKLDAAFSKNIPLKHEYMQTYLKHEADFGGANNILIAMCDASGDIFNANFFDSFRRAHDDVVYTPGIERVLVKSLFSPSTRFIEVVEDGFAGGPVIPANFTADAHGLAKVKENTEKAGVVGRMVADDYSCAMITASLLELDPETNLPVDTIAFASTLENDIRAKYQSEQISVHIIGFAKMVGDVAEGAKGVVAFFGVAIVITSIMVFLFSGSLMLTVLPIACSLIAVVWQIGLLTVLGFGIDPMSILVPFLVFAIGVSHGVQMINSTGKRVASGMNAKTAAQASFRKLLVPGGVALLSDTVGFLTLLIIEIGVIRELAITASLGVAVIILTNLVLLPVLMSFVRFSDKYKQKVAAPNLRAEKVWMALSAFATRPYATVILLATALLFAYGHWQSQQLKIGDLHAGAPALHEDSRYNQDTFMITDRFAISVDYINVMVETIPSACTHHEIMDRIDQFHWLMENVPGVQSAVSLPSVSKVINAAYNEGNAKWRVLPRNTQSLVQASSRVETSTGLLNADCSVMPVMLFLEDHKAETIERVVAAVKQYGAELGDEQTRFALATGPAGVMAATNEAVSDAQQPMMWYVYAAVIVLCLLSFRSVRATAAVIIPLYVVSVLATALMTKLEIGLTVSTLPVIALGVGIGVDYGIYILSTMSQQLREGMPLRQAYFEALKERGSAVLFTGITLAIGVSTWVFSALKFQVDMGILLTFMFIVNMLGAIVVLPALASFFWRKN